MSYLSHLSKIIIKILSTSYHYPRTHLLLCYLKLQISSIVYHKITSRGKGNQSLEVLNHKVLGFTIQFTNYPELIYLVEEIFVYQVYQFSSTTETPFIIDCGSNIGLSILYFKTVYPNSKILGFEPDSQTFKMLEENIRRNRIDNVTLINFALSDFNGSAPLYKAKSSQGSLNLSLLQTSMDYVSEKVETKMLSDFMLEKIEMLKIDVEGCEPQILNEIIAKKKITLIAQMIVEFHPEIISSSIDEYLIALEKHGLVCQEIRKNVYSNSTDVVAHFVNR